MKRTIWTWELFGFALTSFLGTLLHFLYEWLDNAIWIAPFSGVNESTWEHMKLLFWPMLLYAVFQIFFFKDSPGFWRIKLRGTLIGLCLIPIIFYTYNGVIGKSPDFINIAIFFVAAALAYLYETKMLKENTLKNENQLLALLAFLLIATSFVFFSFAPPSLNIFKDPITGAFGI